MVEGEDRSGKRAHAMQRLVTLRGSDLPINLQKREKHCYSSAFPVSGEPLSAYVEHPDGLFQ